MTSEPRADVKEEPVKVAFVLPTLSGGGAESVMLRVLGLIDRSTVRPVLIVGLAEGELADRVPPGIEVVELGRTRTRNAVPRMRRALSVIKPDVVLATLGLGNAVLVAKPLLVDSPKLVLRLGSSLTADGSSGKTSIRAAVLRQILKLLYRRADLVIAQSDFMLSDATNYLGLPSSSFTRIYNPVDVKNVMAVARELEFGSQTRASTRRIVSVGRLHFVKGYDVLLNAFADLLVGYPDSTLTIVGEGPERARLEEKARLLGVVNAVHFLGWKDDPLPVLLGADVYVLSSRYEGLSNALLEALVGGIPVVVTDCPSGNREVVVDGVNGFFCRPNDFRDMSAKIALALEAGGAIPTAEQLRQTRELLSSDRIVREYERALLSAVLNP